MLKMKSFSLYKGLLSSLTWLGRLVERPHLCGRSCFSRCRPLVAKGAYSGTLASEDGCPQLPWALERGRFTVDWKGRVEQRSKLDVMKDKVVFGSKSRNPLNVEATTTYGELSNTLASTTFILSPNNVFRELILFLS